MELPDGLKVKVIIGLEDGSMNFSFSLLNKPLNWEQPLTEDNLTNLCQQAVAGLAGFGLTKLVDSERKEWRAKTEAQLLEVPHFDEVEWVDFNKKAVK